MRCSPDPKHRGHLSELERKAISRIHQLLAKPGLLRANLTYMRRRCGRDYCKCSRSHRHWHGSWYVMQSYRGKKRMQHVSAGYHEAVRHWVNRYREIKGLLNRVADFYWESLKKD